MNPYSIKEEIQIVLILLIVANKKSAFYVNIQMF